MAENFTTIIRKAIQDFGGIQNALNTIGAYYENGKQVPKINTDLTTAGNAVTNNISSQQLMSAISKSATITSDGTNFITGLVANVGSVGTLSLTGSKSGSTFVVSLSKAMSAGYYNGQTLSSSGTITVNVKKNAVTDSSTILSKDVTSYALNLTPAVDLLYNGTTYTYSGSDSLYIKAGGVSTSNDDVIAAPVISRNTTAGTNETNITGDLLSETVGTVEPEMTGYFIRLNTAANSTGKTITTTVTEGYVESDSITKKVSLSGSTNQYFSVKAATISGTKDSSTTYQEFNSPAIVDGKLYITSGYIPNIYIPLGALIPDDLEYPSAAHILEGYSVYGENGETIVGTMKNNGKVSVTLSTQGGIYTIPVGYHDGTGTVTATINNAATLSVSKTNASVTVGNLTSGKYPVTLIGNTTITVGTAGYVKGGETIATSSAGSLNRASATATITAGNGLKFSETGYEVSVTGKSITEGYLKSGDTSQISIPSVHIAEATLSAEAGANQTFKPTISIVDTNGAPNTDAHNTGDSSSTGDIIDSLGALTTTAPSGHFFAVKTNSGSKTVTATATITEGYHEGGNTTDTATVTIESSGTQYIPIDDASFTPSVVNHTNTFESASVISDGTETALTAETQIGSTDTTGFGDGVDYYKLKFKSSSKAKYQNTAAGYSYYGQTGTSNADVVNEEYYIAKSTEAIELTPTVNTNGVITGKTDGTIKNIATTTKPSGTDGTNYWTISSSGTVTTKPKVTVAGKATTTKGFTYGDVINDSETVETTPSISSGTPYYIPLATHNVTDGTATNATAKGKLASQGLIALTTNENSGVVSVKPTGNNASGNPVADGQDYWSISPDIEATAGNVSPGTCTITAGYTPGKTITHGKDVSVSVATSKGNSVYIKKAEFNTTGTPGTGVTPEISLGTHTANATLGDEAGGKISIPVDVSFSGSGTFEVKTTTGGYIPENTVVGTNGVSVSGGDTKYVNINQGAGAVTVNDKEISAGAISKQSDTNVSTGAVTTTKPTSGYYVSVKSASVNDTISATAKINTAGYMEKNDTLTSDSAQITVKEGTTTYVPITAASGLNVTSVSGGDYVTVGTKTGNYYPLTANNLTVKAKHTGAGYTTAATEYSDNDVDGAVVGNIAAGVGSVSVNSPSITPAGIAKEVIASTTDGSKYNLTGVQEAATTTRPTSKYYFAVKTGSVKRSGVITADATIDNAGYMPTSYDFTPDTGDVTINAGSVTYIPINQGAGTVTVDDVTVDAGSLSTVDITDDTANATKGDIYTAVGSATTTKPDEGFYLAVKSNAVTRSGITATAKIGTAGYMALNDTLTSDSASVTIKASNTTYIPVTAAQLSNSSVSGVTYTELTAPTLSGGYLYITKGYIGDVKISLGNLIPDIDTDAVAAYIRKGYKAYTDTGSVITGTMEDLTLSDTYYTTTNTGFGVVTGERYNPTTKYIKAGSYSASHTLTKGAGSVRVDNASGVTLTTDSTSGVSFKAYGSGTVSATGTATGTTGWITGGSKTSTSSSETSNEANLTRYISAINVPASKTFSSFALTAGTADARTYLNSLSVPGYTTVKDLTLTGVIEKISNNSGRIDLMTGTNNRITTMGGSTTITNLGTSDEAATLLVSDNTYGTISIGSATAGDKAIQITNRAVKVDGTTVSESDGDLITATLSSTGSVTTAPSVTISGSTNMATASSGTYYFTRTGSVNNGVVQTTHKASNAGWTTTTSSTNGGTVTVTPTKTADSTIYIPSASVTVTPSVGVTQQYQSGTSAATTNNILLTADPGSNRYIITLDPDATISNTKGYLGSDSEITENSGTTLTRYLARATGSVTNGTATAAKAKAGIDVTTDGELGKLSDEENTGISTTAPGTDKTLGTDYWKITPKLASKTAGSVSAATAKVTTAGYTPTNNSFASGSKVNVSVTEENSTTYYLNKAEMSSSASGGKVTTTISKGGYIPAGTKSEASVATGEYSASVSNNATGFTPSTTATSYYVTATPTATISKAGYLSTGSENGTAAITYISAAAGETSITAGSSFTPSISLYTGDNANIAGKNISADIDTEEIARGTANEPTSGYYIAVQSASQSAKTISATSKITTAGYTPTNNNFSTKSTTVGLNASEVTYIPINSSSVSSGIKSVAEDTTSISGATNIYGSGSVSLTAPKSGYFYAATVTPKHSATSGYTPTLTNVTGTDGKIYVSLTAGAGTVSTTVSDHNTTSENNAFTPEIKKYTTDNSTYAGKNISADTGEIVTGTSNEPTSGYYIAVQTERQNAKKIVADATIGTAGYMSTSYVFNTSTKYVGLNESEVTYIPVNAGSGTTSITTSTINPGAIAIVDVKNSDNTDNDGSSASKGDIYKSLEAITTDQPTSGHYLAVKTNSATRSIGAKFKVGTAGYVAKDSETTGSGNVTVKAGSTYYIPINDAEYSASHTLTKGAGSVTGSNVEFYTDTTNNGISVSGSGTVSATGTATISKSGYVIAGNTTSTSSSETSNTATKYIKKLTIPSGKALGQYTSSSNFTDGVTINGVSGSIGKLYAGFGNSGYGELYLRNAGATSYTKVANAGKLITGSYSATTQNSITAPKVTVSGAATGFTVSSSETPYYVTVSGSGTTGSVTSTSTAKIDSTGWLTAGNKSSGTDTDTITTTILGSGSKVYIPAAALSGKTDSITSTDYTEYDHNGSNAGTGDFGINDGYLYISAGYIPNTKINLGTIIPDDLTYPTASHILTGYSIYGEDGTKIVGTMANQGKKTASIGYGESYTIPAGYHNGQGKVTNSIGAGTIDVTDLTITPSALSGAWDATNSKYIVSQASKTATMQSTVTTAGYVSSSVGTKNTGTATVSAPSNLEIAKATFTTNNGSASLTVAESTAAITDKTNISGSVAAPQTGTTISTPYYYAFTVKSEGSGSVTSSTAGYIPAGETIGSPSVSKSTTTYYAPVTAAVFAENATNPTFKLTANTTAIDGVTLLTDVASASLTVPTTGYALPFKVTSTGYLKTTTAGYVPTGKISTAVSGNDMIYVSVNPGAGSVSVNSPSVSPGAIAKVNIASGTDSDGYDGDAAALGDIYDSLGTVTTTLPGSGYYLAVKSNSVTREDVISADATIGTAGYMPTSYNFTAATGDVTVNGSGNYYIPVTAAVLSTNDQTFKPTISKVDITSATDSDGYNGHTSSLGDIYASTGTVTTTLPSSGYYLAVKSNAQDDKTITTSVTTAGYVSTTKTSTGKAKLSASDTTYIPVNTATFTTSGNGSIGAPNITINETDSTTAGGVNISGVLTKLSDTSEPTSGYFIRLNTTANSTGKTVTTTSTGAGYIANDKIAGSGTVTLSGSDNHFISIAAATRTHSGGGLSKGSASGGGLSKGTASGGGLSGGALTGGSAVTPTVTISSGADTNMENIAITNNNGTKDSTYEYYFKINAASSSGSSTVTRGAVTRSKFTQTVNRAAFSQTVNRAKLDCTETAGYVPAGTHTCLAAGSETVSLAAGSTTVELAADSTTIGQATKTVTVNAGSDSEYIGIRSATCSTNIKSVSENETDILGATNISESGSVSLDAPSSGYFYAVNMTPGHKVTRSGYISATSSYADGTSDIAYVSIDAAILSATNGTGTNTFEVDENATTISGATNISGSGSVSLNAPKSGYFYAIDISASGSGSGSVSCTKSGYVEKDNKVSPSVTVSGNDTAYVSIDAATCTVAGGSLSITTPTSGTADATITLTPVLSVTSQTTSGAGVTTTAPTSGYYITLDTATVSGYKKVTRAAVTDAHTAGYIPAKSASNAISSASKLIKANADVATTYITIPTGVLSNAASTNVTYTEISSPVLKAGDYLYINAGYYPASKISLGTLIPDISSDATASYILTGYKAYTDSGTVITGTMPKVSVTANAPTITPTHGAITPEVEGTVTSWSTTTKPSGTDGTNYVTINPDASITTQPKANASYTYSVGKGYIETAVTNQSVSGTAVNVSPTINDGTNHYIPIVTPSFDGGGLSGGALTQSGNSGGGLSTTKAYTGTPTVDITLDAQTTSGVTITGTKPSSGYYLTIGANSSALSGNTTVKRAAFSNTVTRAKTSRAAVLYNGARKGLINIADNTTALSAGELASATSTVSLGETTINSSVTVNKGTKTEYVVIPSSIIANGFVTTAGYVPKDTTKYNAQYNSTDDCVDILFN